MEPGTRRGDKWSREAFMTSEVSSVLIMTHQFTDTWESVAPSDSQNDIIDGPGCARRSRSLFKDAPNASGTRSTTNLHGHRYNPYKPEALPFKTITLDFITKLPE